MHEVSATRTIDTSTSDQRPTAGRRLSTREVDGFVFSEAAYRAHARTPWHSHPLMSLEVVLGGGYVKRTKGSDYQCGRGTLTVEPPGESHAGIYGPTGWRAIVVEIVPSRLSELTVTVPALSRPLCQRDGRAQVLAQRASAELHMTDSASALVLEGIALELIAVTVRRQPEANRRARGSAWLRQVRERLRDEFRHDIRLATLAEAVGVHPTHLARVFRAEQGCSVGEYVRRLRIEWAARRLAMTTISIATLSRDAGFYDQGHFTRTFKAHMGLSPARYRELLRGQAIDGTTRPTR